MDAEGEVLGGFKKINFPFEKKGVGAEINVFFPSDEAFHDFIDLGMNEGFATGDRNHGGSALIRGRPALFGRKTFVEHMVGVLDFAAPSASQVAAEEGLEHEDEGVPFVATEFLSENVRGDGPSLANGNWHKGRCESTNRIAYVNGTWPAQTLV